MLCGKQTTEGRSGGGELVRRLLEQSFSGDLGWGDCGRDRREEIQTYLGRKAERVGVGYHRMSQTEENSEGFGPEQLGSCDAIY